MANGLVSLPPATWGNGGWVHVGESGSVSLGLGPIQNVQTPLFFFLLLIPPPPFLLQMVCVKRERRRGEGSGKHN